MKKNKHSYISQKKIRAQQEQCYRIAKKVLRHFELDPALLEVYTKKQKEKLFRVFFEPPIVKPDKERTVPRQYVRVIHAKLYQFMKNNFYGKPENQLTHMDFAVYGLSFLLNLSNMYKRDNLFLPGTPQGDAAKLIHETCNFQHVIHHGFNDALSEVWYLTKGFSKVNFRLYGFKYEHDAIHFPCRCCTGLKMTIRLTAQDSESKKFKYNNIERRAFRLVFIGAGNYLASKVTIARKDVFPSAKEEERLNIYIQSHVLHRFKERLDAFSPENRNLLIQDSLINFPQLVSRDKQKMFRCFINDEYPIGYFTFFIQDNDLVINTFLPIASENTLEGKKLHQLLPLSKEEIVYLGMDKVSFFLNVDFEQIPVLKQALIDSGIWQIKVELDDLFGTGETDVEYPIDANKTKFVKDFFDKLQEHRIK